MPQSALPPGLLLTDILQAEDAEAFGCVVCPRTGILAWPAIRNDVFRLILSQYIYQTQTLAQTRAGLQAGRRLRATGTWLKTAWHNRRHPPRAADTLIVSTGAGRVSEGGISRNRYTAYFGALEGHSVWSLEGVVDDADLSRAPGTSFSLPDTARVAVRARFGADRVSAGLARELLSLFAERARAMLGWHMSDADMNALARRFAVRLTAYPLQQACAERWLDRIEPGLVLLEEGCYGPMAVWNATARARGAHVAEFQHGMITRGHDAYNVAPRLAASEAYRKTLPHSLLTYGAWWSAQFNVPVQPVVIGNPHRSSTLAGVRRQAGASDCVLVLGDGIDTSLHLDFCAQLAACVKDRYRVVFRPHPLERHRVTASPEGVHLDVNRDVYQSLAAAQAVVAEYSTCLFDAVGVTPRIYAWRTAKGRFYLPDHPFGVAADPADLARQLHESPEGEPAGSGDEVWAPDWEGRFRRFLRSISAQDETPRERERHESLALDRT